MEGRCRSAAIAVILLGFQASCLIAAPQFSTKQPQNRQPVVLSSQVFRSEQPTFSSPQAQVIFTSTPAKQTFSSSGRPSQVSVTSRGNTQTQFNVQSPGNFPVTVAPHSQGVKKPVVLQRFSSTFDPQTTVFIPSPVRQPNNVNTPRVQSVQAPQPFKVVQKFQVPTQPLQRSQVKPQVLSVQVQNSQARTPEVRPQVAQTPTFQIVQTPQTFEIVQTPQRTSPSIIQTPKVQSTQTPQIFQTPQTFEIVQTPQRIPPPTIQIPKEQRTQTPQIVQTPQTFEIVQTPQRIPPPTIQIPKEQRTQRPQIVQTPLTFEIVQTLQEPSPQTRKSPSIIQTPKEQRSQTPQIIPTTEKFEIIQNFQEPSLQTRKSPSAIQTNKVQSTPTPQIVSTPQTFEKVQTLQRKSPSIIQTSKEQRTQRPQIIPTTEKFEIVETLQDPRPQTRKSPSTIQTPKEQRTQIIPTAEKFEIVQTLEEPSPPTRKSPKVQPIAVQSPETRTVQTTNIPTSTAAPKATTIRTPFRSFIRVQKKKRPDFRVDLSTSKTPVRVRAQESDAIVTRPLEIHEEQTPVAFKRPKPAEPPRIPQEVEEDDSEDLDDEQEREKQILDAQYSFRSEVNDPLSDSNIVREEKREDGAVEGMYSYSDGFFRRTVRYRADRLGYRVLSEDVEPLGDGPKPDPKGLAKVAVTSTSGVSSHYTVSASDILKPSKTPLKEETEEEQED